MKSDRERGGDPIQIRTQHILKSIIDEMNLINMIMQSQIIGSTTIDIVHAILFILHETRRYTFKFWKKDTLDISENCGIHENADTIIFPKRKLCSQNCITTAVVVGRGEQSGICFFTRNCLYPDIHRGCTRKKVKRDFST